MRTLFIVSLLIAGSVGYPVWVVKTSGVDTNLRGVSLAHARNRLSDHAAGPVVWASGSNGVILRSPTTAGPWVRLYVRGGEALDFRGIQAFDEKTAYVMSSGEGEKSRIYKTTDGGENWAMQFTDSRGAFFLDALVCDGPTHCLALSDPVDGKFLLVGTTDGEHWKTLPQDTMPPAIKDEGAFAASGTCLAVYGSDIYFVTGGPAARLFHSPDLGRTWTVTALPIVSGSPGAGAFSVARRGKNMVVVGGDYKNPKSTDHVAAYSRDAGKSWTPAEQMPGGYRSAVAWLDNRTLAAVGPTGEEISVDGGAHWKPNSALNLNAVAAVDFEHAWAVGANGTICHFSLETQ
ncbi:MAG TPA: hypothetical protein VGD60_03560 [Candidatus Acidoferrales bacterium]